MRAELPECVLITDGSDLSKEFAWSLRYSTHCLYYVTEENFQLSNYKFFCNISDINVSNTVVTNKKNFLISTINEKIVFSCGSSKGLSEGNDVAEYFPKRKKFFNISKEKALHNINPTNIYNDVNIMLCGELSLYLLSDFEGEISIVGAVAHSRENDFIVDHNSNNFSIFNEELSGNLAGTNNEKNLLFNIKIQFDHANKGISDFSVSEKLNAEELRLLRAGGINLPLLIVQNLYRRKVRTFKFVDALSDRVSNEISYSLDFNTIFFDLDETLIWLGSPIYETIELLELFYKKGFTLKLLTRHKKNIINTLELISVNPAMFSEIIKVELNQRKSEFVHTGGIFIDNEFPERFDVRFSGGIPALDLDQIEFIRLD